MNTPHTITLFYATIQEVMELIQQDKDEEACVLFNTQLFDSYYDCAYMEQPSVCFEEIDVSEIFIELDTYLNNEGARVLHQTSKARIKEIFRVFKNEFLQLKK